MIAATRRTSSSRKALNWSPARNQGVQPSFFSVSFHAGVSVAACTSFTSAVALRRRDARRAEDAAPVAEHHVDALLLQRRDAFHPPSAADTASARIRPALICSANSPSPETPAVT